MKTQDFAYELPQALIAQRPLPVRDASRLLVMERGNGRLTHHHFTDIVEYLHPGDILVVNDTRVIPARIFGRKATGGRVELLLLEQLDDLRWKAIVGGKKVDGGVTIELENGDGLMALVTAVLDGPQREISFNAPVSGYLAEHGHTPLPPYIHESLSDPERYQTVYARYEGSAAAPTAGLHFTPDLLLALRQKGILLEMVTLHVGLDTFKPVDVEEVADHQIHSEWARISPETARRINEAKLAGGRLIAVGTTAMRTLETGALRSAGINGSLRDISLRDASGETSNFCPWKPVSAFTGATDLFIYPGYKFRAVDGLITNFHLPQSSLLMLVSAFAGREAILAAYETAVQHAYRFFSFGDAMFIY